MARTVRSASTPSRAPSGSSFSLSVRDPQLLHFSYVMRDFLEKLLGASSPGIRSQLGAEVAAAIPVPIGQEEASIRFVLSVLGPFMAPGRELQRVRQATVNTLGRQQPHARGAIFGSSDTEVTRAMETLLQDWERAAPVLYAAYREATPADREKFRALLGGLVVLAMFLRPRGMEAMLHPTIGWDAQGKARVLEWVDVPGDRPKRRRLALEVFGGEERPRKKVPTQQEQRG